VSTPLEDLRSALPERESKLLIRLGERFRLADDDEMWVLLGSLGLLVREARESQEGIESLAGLLQSLPSELSRSIAKEEARLRESVSESIMTTIASGADTLTQEVVASARALATSEFRAATMIRDSSISVEVERLRVAAEELARREVSGGEGGSRFEWLSIESAVLLIVGVVSGVVGAHVLPLLVR